jgi:hypothetical protein
MFIVVPACGRRTRALRIRYCDAACPTDSLCHFREPRFASGFSAALNASAALPCCCGRVVVCPSSVGCPEDRTGQPVTLLDQRLIACRDAAAYSRESSMRLWRRARRDCNDEAPKQTGRRQ